MDALEMRRRVVSARVGHLGTAAPMPHVVPVCYALVGETAYTAVDHKPKRSTRLQRVANVEATGRACLLADEYDEDWTRLWWVRIDGPARPDPSSPWRPSGGAAGKRADCRTVVSSGLRATPALR